MLNDADRSVLTGLGRERRYRAGAVLFREGDAPGAVHLLLEGRVKVHTVAPTGRELLLAFKEPGELLGELAAIDDLPRSATASAVDDVRTSVVTAGRFREVAEARPGVAFQLLHGLSGELRAAGNDQLVRTDGTVTERVAARLLTLARRFDEHDGPSVVVPLRLSHDDLAAWTSTTRESVTRAMAQLRRSGAVVTRPGRVTVVDVEQLAAHTAGASAPAGRTV
ncbi:MAG TPA: Crp/Fnr family transcriptional regulator [Acidimicrobiales bacterium]|nr:Crp/Fnr family transcriptional regulator [Acidimicrobiales bacterium]